MARVEVACLSLMVKEEKTLLIKAALDIMSS